ncbi:hypothetical protein CK203_045428 [Vitis vinifera]|uniref:TRF2/HOY1 PH-like domain-containing protein n=1 Tax=Vitis vinifera TaxID=29760 RepID=A0A438HXY5_VITVI|nr:hypothetical protein CK203_045428 [Vitis vinifera]
MVEVMSCGGTSAEYGKRCRKMVPVKSEVEDWDEPGLKQAQKRLKLYSSQGAFVGKKRKKAWKATPLCLFWTLWKERNQRAFEDSELTDHKILCSFMYMILEWVRGLNQETGALHIPPLQYNLLDEPSPLGLQLKKSPSFLDLIQMRLTQGNAPKLGSVGKKVTKGTPVISASEKLKASNFAASILRIGKWEYVSRYEGDLVAKCYFAKHKLVWEILDGSLKNKIEIQWSDIIALKANCPSEGPGTLDVVLARQPLFFRETPPQPRKHTLWQTTADFTGGQASLYSLWTCNGLFYWGWTGGLKEDASSGRHYRGVIMEACSGMGQTVECRGGECREDCWFLSGWGVWAGSVGVGLQDDKFCEVPYLFRMMATKDATVEEFLPCLEARERVDIVGGSRLKIGVLQSGYCWLGHLCWGLGGPYDRQHYLQCPQGLLGKHFEKLIQCDPRLNFLSKQPEIVLDFPYFGDTDSVLEDPDESKSHDFGLKREEDSSFSGLQDAPSRGQLSSSKIDPQDPVGGTTEIFFQNTLSPSSVMDTHVIEENGSIGTEGPKWLNNLCQIKVPGLHSSMSMSDLVSHIGHCLSEQTSSCNPIFPSDEPLNQDILEQITQYMFNDAQLSSASDEQSIMSRVNSLCCLLQNEPAAVQNFQVKSENGTDTAGDGSIGELNPIAASCESKTAGDFPTPNDETNDVSSCKQPPAMSRKDSVGELLVNLPRIASLPQFLFNM